MSPRNKKILQFFIFLSIGVFLVWLSIRNVSTEDIKTAFTKANYFWVFISILTALLSHVSRAMRWKLLLEPLGYKTKTETNFYAVMVGYLANYGIPRLGEISRCTLLSRYEKVPFQVGFGTVVTERIVDVLSLLVVLMIALLIEFNEFIGIGNRYIFDPLSEKLNKLATNQTLLIILIAAFILIFIALYILRKKIRKLFSGKIGAILKGFLSGIQSIRKLKKPGLFIAHSFFIWLMYLLGIYVCFFCFPETSHLDIGAASSILLAGTFGVMISPVGAYQLIVQGVMLFYAISTVYSAAFPWVVWGSNFIVVLIFGLFSLLLLPIRNKTT